MKDFFTVDPSPESNEVTLTTSAGVQIDRWTSYEFGSDFLTPADGFSFTYEPGDTSQAVVKKILADFAIGTEVTLRVDGAIQGVGYIDDIDIRGSKDTGLQVDIEGRTKIGYAVDACVDPGTVFPKDSTLEDFLLKLYSPFGFDNIFIDNDAGREIATSNIRHKVKRTYSTGKRRKRHKHAAVNPLNKYTLDTQLKPYPGEGVHAFATRVAHRHGLWIWCDSTGNLVVSRPNYDQDAIYQLVRKSGDATAAQFNNIKSGGVRRSGKDQPSAIFAASQAGSSPDFLRSTRKLYAINPAVYSDDLADLKNRYSSVRQIDVLYPSLTVPTVKYGRPIFLYDPESRTEEQLEAFIRRELALRIRKAVVATYVVDGHVSNGAAWNVDTIAVIDDDWADVHDTFWIISRKFRKNRRAGTETHLELIQKGAIDFAVPEVDEAKADEEAARRARLEFSQVNRKKYGS